MTEEVTREEIEAVRAGCNDACIKVERHPACTYPDCTCRLAPVIVRAALAASQSRLASAPAPSPDNMGLERARCAKIVQEWLTIFGSKNPQHVSAQTWANDAARDILEAIRSPLPPPPAPAPEKSVEARLPRKATDCLVTACIGNHVHIELLDDSKQPFAEFVCESVDEATKLIMQIEKQCDDIMKGLTTATVN